MHGVTSPENTVRSENIVHCSRADCADRAIAQARSVP